MTYSLNSPFIELEWERKPENWGVMVVSWFLFWVVIIIGILYLYSVVFPSEVGFKTALLVGIGLLVLGNA